MGVRFLAFAILFVGLAGLAVMLLWNALLPAILGVSAISFWQAVGLLALSRILFGGWRGGRGWGGEHGPGRRDWKQKMTERWQQMTPEQRARMKEQWRDRCGNRGRGRWDTPDEPDPTTTAI